MATQQDELNKDVQAQAEQDAQAQQAAAQQQAAAAQDAAQKQVEDQKKQIQKNVVKGMAVGALTTIGRKLLSTLMGKISK